VAKDREKLWAVVKTVTAPQVPYNAGTVLHGAS